VTKLQPVLLSGGSGTRLWPLSREAYPKQFLPLVGKDTMLQATWRRIAALATLSPIVVAGEDHRFLVAEQLRQAGAPSPAIVLEPVGRNTAPAIAAAALQATADGGDPLLLVLPSDHVVRDAAAFRAAVQAAMPAACAGALVTFGIVPSAPETGFGYIQAGADAGGGLHAVLRFVEKPDADTARDYLAAGGYYWNSGMFLFRASKYLAELARFRPDILEATRAVWRDARRDGDFIRLDRDAFAATPADSIDYAVMEKTDAALVLPVDIGWNDVGSWSALWDVAERDEHGNARVGDVIRGRQPQQLRARAPAGGAGRRRRPGVGGKPTMPCWAAQGPGFSRSRTGRAPEGRQRSQAALHGRSTGPGAATIRSTSANASR